MDAPLKTWLYTGTWRSGFIIMIVELNEGYITFDYDGESSYWPIGKPMLEKLPLSWELAP